MKHYIAALIIVLGAVSALGQTNLRTVMVNSNGVVERPTNFISTNGIVTANTTNGSVLTPTNFWNNVVPTNFWATNGSNIVSTLGLGLAGNQTTQRAMLAPGLLNTATNGGAVYISNSIVTVQSAATNATSASAVRLMAQAGSRAPNGSGTLWASLNNEFWVTGQYAMAGTNNRIRVVVGNDENTQTNVAVYPVNKAVGYEVLVDTNADIRIRLIAHNGTSATNGPFVSLSPAGDIFQRYTIGVKVNKTNGFCSLFIGTNSFAPVEVPAAQIVGPTNNGDGGDAAFDIGAFNTETNSIGANAIVIDAYFIQKP